MGHTCAHGDAAGFLEDLANVLHPAHGSFLMNMHGNAETMTRGLLPPAQPFDPQSAAGQQIVQVSSKFRSVLHLPDAGCLS